MNAYETIAALRQEQIFSPWLGPWTPSEIGPLVLLDDDERPAILRLLMRRGGYVDIWLVGEKTGCLAATGPGTGMVKDYAIIFGKVFNNTPKVRLADPSTLEKVHYHPLSLSILNEVPPPPPGSLIRWHCPGLADEQEQQENWCVPRCISIVSVRFAARITQKQAACAWHQAPKATLDTNNASDFADFENKCKNDWKMKSIVSPSEPLQATYEWFASRKVPTVFGLQSHAYVCTGTCDAAPDRMGHCFECVAVIDPADGQEHWLTVDTFGSSVLFALEAPGDPCPRFDTPNVARPASVENLDDTV